MRNMRTAGVCLSMLAIVCGPASLQSEGQEKTWNAVHQAGIDAFEASHFDDALQAFESALPLAATPDQRAATLNDIGNALRGAGRNSEALSFLEEALRTWRGMDPAGEQAAETAVSLANAQRFARRYVDAEAVMRTAIGMKPRAQKSTASLLNTLGDLLREEDRLAEAREQFEAALKIAPDAENRIDALIGRADVERSQSEWQASVADWNRAIALSREQRSESREAIALAGLGTTYADTGAFARAEPVLKRALATFDAETGMQEHSAVVLEVLATVYRDQNKYALAEKALRRALELQDEKAGRPPAGVTLELLAGLMALEKRFAEAVTYARRAEEIMRGAFPPDSPPIAGALATKAYVEQRAGDLEAAERDYAEALRNMRANGSIDSSIGGQYMTGYARVLRQLHKEKEAKAVEAGVKAFREGRIPHPQG